MKQFLFLALILTLPLSFFAQRIDVKFKFDGEDREFIVVKPTGSTPAGGYPVVFMLHGSSGTGDEFYNKSGWKEVGEKEKFLTVFPTALKYCALNFPDNNPVRITKWNNGNLQEDKCPNVAQVFKDDVKFIRKMVDTIKQTFNVNAKKIFASGFSNGGAMAMKLAMDAPDVFAAVANGSSSLNALDSTKPARVIPIWTMIGSKDDRYTTSLGIPEIPFGGDSVLSYLGSVIRRVITCESLTQTYTKNNTPRTNTFIFDKPSVPGNTNRYIFTLVDNMFHVYPNGENYPLVAAELFWEFFKQSVTTDVAEIKLPDNLLKAYPNPAGENMTLDIPEKWSSTEGGTFDLTVYNLLGENVFNLKNQQAKQVILNKKDIGHGMFVMKLRQGQEVILKKIVFE